MAAHHVPEGYHSVTPHLVVDGAEEAIRFYEKAFGAVAVVRMPMGDGRLAHAEIRIGDSFVMLADEHPDEGFLGPRKRGGATGSLLIYVEDVDAAYRRAVEAGATEQEPPTDQFWGDRMGSLSDPFGHRWSLATHVEDVSDEEMQRRMAQVFAS